MLRASLATVILISAGALAQDGDYRSRLILTANRTIFDIRFNVRTGETWAVSIEDVKKLEESGKVGPGSYELATVAAETNWWAFRYERKSGRAWALYEGKWNDIKEKANPPEGNYEITLQSNKDEMWSRRTDRVSGRIWYARWSGKEFEWVELGKKQ